MKFSNNDKLAVLEGCMDRLIDSDDFRYIRELAAHLEISPLFLIEKAIQRRGEFVVPMADHYDNRIDPDRATESDYAVSDIEDAL